MTAPRCKHTWSVRIDVETLLGNDGHRSGWYVVGEHKRCAKPGCDAFQTRRVPGTRSRSPEASLAAYARLAETETTS